jgi:beta-phosphoglucomutase-like phosphatase (HAD superfamily)
VREARAHCVAGGVVDHLSRIAEAEAGLARGEYKRALRLATSAADAMNRRGAARFVGSALRIRAEALERMGLTADAVWTIRNAIEALQAHGHPYALATAYRCAARLTGERRFKTAARNLTAALML